MKPFLLIFLALTCCISTAASTLLFRSKRALDSVESFTEVAQLDTSKYRQVRVQLENIDECIKKFSYCSNFGVVLTAAELPDPEIILTEATASVRFSSLIDLPPSVLRIKIKGKGLFRMYVWAD